MANRKTKTLPRKEGMNFAIISTSCVDINIGVNASMPVTKAAIESLLYFSGLILLLMISSPKKDSYIIIDYFLWKLLRNSILLAGDSGQN